MGKERHFTMKERPSTIPKQVVLMSEAISSSLQLGRKRGEVYVVTQCHEAQETVDGEKTATRWKKNCNAMEKYLRRVVENYRQIKKLKNVGNIIEKYYLCTSKVLLNEIIVMKKLLSLITLLLLSVATFAEDFDLVGTWYQYEADVTGIDGIWIFNADNTGSKESFYKGESDGITNYTYVYDAVNKIITIYPEGGSDKVKGRGKKKEWVIPITIVSATEFTYSEDGDVLTWIKQTTGIQGVYQHETGTGAVYSLSGQRHASPQKGINIVQGKKVIVK